MTYSARFVTQTDESPPWIDCGWATTSMWIDKGCAGQMKLIDKDTLRARSGDKVGGSSIYDMARGTAALFPSIVMAPAWLAWSTVERMGAEGYGFAVLIQHELWPSTLRRWSPGFRGGHWVYMEDFQTTAARGSTFRLLNPLGRGAYNGERAASADMKRAAAPYMTSLSPVLEGSLVYAVTTISPFEQRIFTIPPSTVTGYRFDPTTGKFTTKTIPVRETTKTIAADAAVGIEQYPLRGKKPSGAYVRIVNGAFAGWLVAADAGTLAPAPVPEPIDCGVLVTAATTPLLARLAQIDAIASPVEVPA